MTLTHHQRQQIQHNLQQQGILAAWLYGSYAKGTANQRSDVDLAVLLLEDQNDWQILPELDYELSKALHLTVHCVSIAKTPTPLAYEAVEGERLFGDADAMFMEQRIWSKWDEWLYWSQRA